MSARKSLTLRERLRIIKVEGVELRMKSELILDRVLRLIREDRKRHCAECLRVKQAIEGQIQKNNSVPIPLVDDLKIDLGKRGE